MLDSLFYKISLLIMMVTFMIFKYRLTTKNQTDEENEGNIHSPTLVILLSIASVGLIFLPLLWVFSDFLDFATIRFSESLRIFGIFLYLSVIILMIWQMRTLDVNISLIRDDRYLVTNGPYRYIRHPLYSIFIVQSLASSLIATNWLLFIFIPVVFVAMALRVPSEEETLVNEYGQDYLDYRTKTKKFFPIVY